MLVLPAGKAQLMHAYQRDASVLVSIRDKLAETLVDWFGPRAWVDDEIDLLSEVLYFTPTLLGKGKTTIGEDYVDIYPIVFSRSAPPTRLRLFTFFLLRAVVPYLYKLLKKRGRTIPNPVPGEEARREGLARRFVRQMWNRLLTFTRNPSSKNLQLNIERLHSLSFFYFGAYLTLSHRFASIRFVNKRRPPNADAGYEILGHMILIRLLVAMFMYYKETKGRSVRQRQLSEEDLEEYSGPEFGTCTLCLSSMEFPSVTECGHVFCWHCIVEWASKKPECPMCRAACHPQKIIPLSRPVKRNAGGGEHPRHQDLLSDPT